MKHCASWQVKYYLLIPLCCFTFAHDFVFWLCLDPKITLQFGVVLSNHLSSELGLKRNTYYLYDLTFSEVQPYSQLAVGKNVTDEFIIKWATKRTMVSD